jgi:2'-5' RNA ligase
METMRLFIAVDLSESMKAALIEAQNEMYDGGVRGSYTREENLHLTLAFIGEMPDAEPALEALSGVSFTPFELSLEGLGCFGDLWWAGMRASPALEALARRVRRALADSGVPFDRKRFSPHVTLLRKARGPMPGIRIGEASMTVDAFSLLRSDRGKGGMIYTELGRFPAAPAREN